MIDAIASVLGLVVPPAFDFIKKKFLKPNADNPSATLSTLATTKPEIIDKFVAAQAELLKAQKDYFNRDVIGMPSLWVVNMRASIRPIFVILSLSVRGLGWNFGWNIDAAFKVLMDVCISSWFGSRLK